MALHKNITAPDNHIAQSLTYADATARTAASGFVAADLGRVALQQSDNSFWILSGYSPVAWTSISGGGASLTSNAPANVNASAAAVGTGTAAARDDHKHNIDTGTPVDTGTANAAGSATSLAKSDHVHNTPFSAVNAALAAANASVSVNSQKITNLLDPTGAQDAASKAYVDSVSGQRSLGTVSYIAIQPAASANPLVLGDLTITKTGTLSCPTLATTNLLAQLRRFRVASTAGAGNSSGIRGDFQIAWRGNAAGLGGFRFDAVLAIPTNLSGQRLFVGLYNGTGALASADPSALTDIVGIALDGADSNLQIMHNDAAGTCTKVDLGSNFARSATDVWRIHLEATPNASTITYTVKNLVSGNTTNGTLSTNLPTNTAFLSIYAWTNNNATASSAQIEIANIHLEGDI